MSFYKRCSGPLTTTKNSVVSAMSKYPTRDLEKEQEKERVGRGERGRQ